MAAPDVFGEKIERSLKNAADRGEGISYESIMKQTGCGKARVFQWLNNNEARWRVVGFTPTGGRLFAAVPDAGAGAIGTGKIDDGIELGRGDTLRVADVAFRSGGMQVTLETALGTQFVISLTAAPT